MTEWRLIDSGPCDAAYNMALDEAIAVFVRRGRSRPALRIYCWKVPSVSIGSFQNAADIDSEYCAVNSIPVVRRPTGGRAILHGDELTYSFSSKNEGPFSQGLLASYRNLGLALSSALEMIGLRADMKKERVPGSELVRSPLCFQSTSYGEISSNAWKLVGSAQKRWSDGFLQQGAIPYSVDNESMSRIFRLDSVELTGLRGLLPDLKPEDFRKCLGLSFEKHFGVTFVQAHPSVQEQELALRLAAEKYSDRHRTLGEQKPARFCGSNGTRKRA